MFPIQRTWLISASTNFLGYEYAVEESEALAKTIAKFGIPNRWGVENYTIEKIKWAEDRL